MSRILKIVLLLVALTLVTLSMSGWWLLRFDQIEEPQLPGTLERGVIEHDGLQRSWTAYVPKSVGKRPPLLLVLHGSMGRGEDMRIMSFYGFDAQAERGGYIAVYPDGYERHWNDCRASASYAANTQNIDDVGFLRALVGEMERRYGVNSRQIYAAGFSNGGQMAFRLALEAPDLVRGIAAISASLPAQENLGCQAGGGRVAALVINGTEDPVNPYEGGMVKILWDDSRGPVISSVATAEYFAGLAGYGGSYLASNWPDKAPDDGTSVSSMRWSLPGRPPVELLTVKGGGHTIPNPTFNLPRLTGTTSHEFDAPQVIWDFFEQR
ncbi:polyhydroxybutyrate depolymerase [Mangrovimicrobium sediminis]|uniref:Polyhydroxybutyrate depolymerase n=1 Tax=Mangrovimicrobium sediminis TaxID=2562682 RepID=A0A4Z0LU15_9GAMM|nr:dienelactone hydrolase family protein [Haliea sp. SAOS-164]TGD70903.1 polyhydroxybutyrate depolymerase [Haliea sp. SAOS-164]